MHHFVAAALKDHIAILKDKNYFVCPEVVILNLEERNIEKY
jgi:hypothetical protein